MDFPTNADSEILLKFLWMFTLELSPIVLMEIYNDFLMEILQEFSMELIMKLLSGNPNKNLSLVAYDISTGVP